MPLEVGLIETPGLLPKQGKDNSFDVVVRPEIGRAILVKGPSAEAACEILNTANTSKAELSAQRAEQCRKLLEQWAKNRAQRAEQEAKLRAQQAEQKAKLSAQRTAQFCTIVAALRGQGSIQQVQQVAGQSKVRMSKIPEYLLPSS